MNLASLEFLVKFLSAATFAVCILAIIWAAMQLRMFRHRQSPAASESYSRFINMCIGIAVIAGVAGLSNAFLNYGQVAAARNEAAAARQEADDIADQFNDALTQVDALTAATRQAGDTEQLLAGASQQSRSQAAELASLQRRLDKATQALRHIDSDIDYVSDAINRLSISSSDFDTLSLRSQIADIKKSARDGLQ